METCLPVAAERMMVVFHTLIAVCYVPVLPVALIFGYRHIERGIMNGGNHWLARLERASFVGLLTAAVASGGLHYWLELTAVTHGHSCSLEVWQSVTAGFLAGASVLLTGAVCWIVYAGRSDAHE